MRTTDIIICISRDETLLPSVDNAHPEYNITLTPSGASNVDAAKLAKEVAAS